MKEQSKQLDLLREYILFEIDKTIQNAPAQEAFNRLDLVWKILEKLNDDRPSGKGAC